MSLHHQAQWHYMKLCDGVDTWAVTIFFHVHVHECPALTPADNVIIIWIKRVQVNCQLSSFQVHLTCHSNNTIQSCWCVTPSTRVCPANVRARLHTLVNKALTRLALTRLRFRGMEIN